VSSCLRVFVSSWFVVSSRFFVFFVSSWFFVFFVSSWFSSD
jgi:hypothetical protein